MCLCWQRFFMPPVSTQSFSQRHIGVDPLSSLRSVPSCATRRFLDCCFNWYRLHCCSVSISHDDSKNVISVSPAVIKRSNQSSKSWGRQSKKETKQPAVRTSMNSFTHSWSEPLQMLKWSCKLALWLWLCLVEFLKTPEKGEEYQICAFLILTSNSVSQCQWNAADGWEV